MLVWFVDGMYNTESREFIPANPRDYNAVNVIPHAYADLSSDELEIVLGTAEPSDPDMQRLIDLSAAIRHVPLPQVSHQIVRNSYAPSLSTPYRLSAEPGGLVMHQPRMFIAEPDHDERIHEGRVKRFTGGEGHINQRRMELARLNRLYQDLG